MVGSWGSDNTKMRLSSDLQVIMERTPSWEVISHQHNLITEHFVGSSWESVTFSMVVSRISTYYTAQVVMLGVLLAIVTWFSFFMDRIVQPPRTALTMIALLSQITLRVVVSKHIPQTNQQTWIEGYQSALLLMNFIGVACWVIIIFLHQSILKHHACTLVFYAY